MNARVMFAVYAAVAAMTVAHPMGFSAFAAFAWAIACAVSVMAVTKPRKV